jgi:capsular polysaccharide biosynthesis protein
MSFGSALKRSWPLVAICLLLCTGAGVAVGLSRHPVYRADAQVFVGQLDVRSLAVPGFVTASQQLAEAYARIIESDEIVRPVARALHRSPSYVRSHVTATNIPETSFVQVRTTASGGFEAVKLAKVTVIETTRYSDRLTGGGGVTDRLLARYGAAAAAARERERTYGQLHQQDLANPGSVKRADLIKAGVDADTARLRANAMAQAYTEARANATGAVDIRVIQTAGRAGDDRSSVLQQLVFFGFVAGLALGCALALLRRRRLLLRG